MCVCVCVCIGGKGRLVADRRWVFFYGSRGRRWVDMSWSLALSLRSSGGPFSFSPRIV